MDARKGVDFTASLTPERAKALVDAGYTFVCRYLVPEFYETHDLRWKRLTASEAKIASDAGLDILSVFETSADRVSGGAAAGRPDGQEAYKQAQLVGQPKGSAIYFAVDFDAQPSQYDVLERYLRAAAEEIDGYEVGVYGSYFVVEEMMKRGAAKHGWQTAAWSSKRKPSRANVYQYQNGVNVCGVVSDLNESYGNEGFWSLRTSQRFSDVNPTAWYASSVEQAASDGLLGGYPDGTFKPSEYVTRAQLAVVLTRLKAAGIAINVNN